MLRIRRIYDDFVPVNREILRQVKAILQSRFSEVPTEEIDLIGEKLRNPFKQRLRSVLFVAENLRRRVLGFAMLLHEPQIGFCFLDWIASVKGKTGGGIGGALYERVRHEAVALEAKGLFFECLPDEFEACPDNALLKENRARLRFYERYGARPIINTNYELPVKPGDRCMPHLVYDGLDRIKAPRCSFTRKVVRALLERKYANYCPPEYVTKVIRSFRDNPVQLRPLRYVKPEAVRATVTSQSDEQIVVVINDRHEIHHVHERGYVESPVRIRSITAALMPHGLFVEVKPRKFPDKHLYSVHDADFVNYLRRACREVDEKKSLYPYIFPIRNKTRPPREPSVLSGYYCIDTFTPLNRNAYPAARRGVDCALTAARELLEGRRITYALVRPPGHHAERRSFGGFCYFNNNAIAAQYLSAYGKVAILDIDYHHGNGQQDIFYRRSDVLTVSIHGHPDFAYPYFSGFKEECGEGEGEGFSLNMPLPEAVDGAAYLKALEKALRRIGDFKADFLVVALGLDPAKGDPTGTWSLNAKDFEANGRLIGGLGLPTLVVQEGGYRTRSLGTNALHFFKGLSFAAQRWAERHKVSPERLQGIQLRHELQPEDPGRIRHLVEITGFFSQEEVDVAEELAQERLARGAASGYHFVMAEQYGRLVGYACYGQISCTVGSYDLYWIAVHPDIQGKGLGQRLLQETEHLIRDAGGSRIYVDTSQRLQYASTRAFYENAGYRLDAVLTEFYAPGDNKVIYCKSL
jgi:acetoin utilization deacetylase AcuC-like enzyme/GNAT superfamily N-acetyltransferase